MKWSIAISPPPFSPIVSARRARRIGSSNRGTSTRICQQKILKGIFFQFTTSSPSSVNFLSPSFPPTFWQSKTSKESALIIQTFNLIPFPLPQLRKDKVPLFPFVLVIEGSVQRIRSDKSIADLLWESRRAKATSPTKLIN